MMTNTEGGPETVHTPSILVKKMGKWSVAPEAVMLQQDEVRGGNGQWVQQWEEEEEAAKEAAKDQRERALEK